MKPDWTLIANATRARLLQQDPGAPMVIVKSFSHPESRGKVSDRVDDRAGHDSTDHSYGGTSFQPRTDPRRKEHDHFAREIADYLEAGALQERFRSLSVFASSPFLGELKARLGDATGRLLAGTHDLDLTAVGLAELERRIAYELEH
jgi:protein required for attachment to host cells